MSAKILIGLGLYVVAILGVGRVLGRVSDCYRPVDRARRGGL